MSKVCVVVLQVMGLLAIPHIQTRNWVVQDWDTVQWGNFLNVMFW